MKKETCELCNNLFEEHEVIEMCITCFGKKYIEHPRIEGEVLRCDRCNGTGEFRYIEDVICMQCFFNL
jgi:DnaJ-class molecular chaperone